MKKTHFFLGGLLCFLNSQTFSQTNQRDSLAGFDEAAAIRASLSEKFFEPELGVHMNQLKRAYINAKFSLNPESFSQLELSTKSAAAACLNEDFESSTAGTITSSTQVSGWVITRGLNTNGNNNCNLTGCCTTNPSEATIISAANGYTDATIGSMYPIYSVFGSVPGNTNAAVANPQINFSMAGTNFIRLNSNLANYSLERISKTILVSSSNALFRLAFIAVQPSGHSCCDAGGFILRITNATTNTFLSAVSYSASGYSSSCTSTTGVTYLTTGTGAPAGPTSTMVFNKWHVNYLDLSPYIGQNITIEVTTGDCTAGGHYAYAYFDSECGPLDVTVNGAPNNLSCFSTATVSGPSNLNSYNWTGPNNFSSTAASFTTNTAGVYTLSIPQNPPYFPIDKTLSLVISPASVTLSASKETICKGEKTVLQALGLNLYNWSGGGSSSSKTVQPNSTTTYTLTGSNSDNCPAFALITITVNACTGIEKLNEAEQYKVYPNPNRGEFYIRIEHEVEQGEMLLLNAFGQLVHTQTIHKGENSIHTKNLVGGVYYYTIKEKDIVIVQGKLKLE